MPSGGHSHSAADLRDGAGSGYVLKDDGTWSTVAAAGLASDAVTTAKILDLNVTTGKLAAAAVTSAKLDATTIQYAEVAVTNAQLKALRATPKTLVAAPGAAFVLEFVSAWLFLDYGTNVLTESADNLAIKYTDGSGQAVSETIESTGFIDATADAVMPVQPIATTAVILKTACANKALVLHNAGDGEIAGNAANDTVLRVKIAYRVHTHGW